MIFTLSACQTKYEQKLICTQIEQHQIPPVRLCDISFQFERCRCRCFDYNTWSVLPANLCPEFAGAEALIQTIGADEVIDYEIEYCEGLGGSFVQDQALKIKPNVKALSRVKDNLCPQK